MAKQIGYDPNSFGLIQYGTKAVDKNYIPTARVDGLTKYVFNPLNFVKGASTVNPHYKNIPDFRWFIRSITSRGIVTNGHSSNQTTTMIPIKAGRNAERGNPFEYAKLMMNTPEEPEKAPPKLKPWLLDYIPEIGTFYEIDLKDLPGMDMTSSGSVSVSGAGGGSLSFPLPFILDTSRNDTDQGKIKVERITSYTNGFRYKIHFAGQEVMIDYTNQPRQMCIMNNQQSFMLSEFETDYQMKQIQAFRLIPEIIMDVFSGNIDEVFKMMANSVSELVDIFGYNIVAPVYNSMTDVVSLMDNVFGDGSYDPEHLEDREFTEEQANMIMRFMITLGGLTNPAQIMDMFHEYFLYDARAQDRMRQSSNIGGNVVTNMLGEEIEPLLTISYPVANRVRTKTKTIYPGKFAENETHSYPVNKVFGDINSFLRYVKETYPGELLSFDGEPIITYGEYSSEASALFNKGLMFL